MQSIILSSGQEIRGRFQEFIHDPYMQLNPIPEIFLCSISSASSSELEELIKIVNMPIIARSQNELPSLLHIQSSVNEKTKLIEIRNQTVNREPLICQANEGI